MTSADTLVVASWVVTATGLLTFGVLWWVPAPYGRFLREGWGPTLPSRRAWMLMESPSAIGFLAIYVLGRHRLETIPLVLLAMWEAHYLRRAFVFPLRMDARGKRMPWVITGMGFFFNCVNTWLNAVWISNAGHYGAAWLWDPRFVAGIALFATGHTINHHADAVLFALRPSTARQAQGRPEPRYRIPFGGLYRWVSCPNYLGEILGWSGWALATWSWPGLAFAVFTLANLAPRALSTHRWYRETFPDYPAERKALIPFVV
jgi:protein-S-isoprenylcysteine O-methyltransferase Ste14